MEISVKGLAKECAKEASFRNLFDEIVRHANIYCTLAGARKIAVRRGYGREIMEDHDRNLKEEKNLIDAGIQKLYLLLEKKGMHFPQFGIKEYANYV